MRSIRTRKGGTAVDHNSRRSCACIVRCAARQTQRDTFENCDIPEIPGSPKVVLIGGTGRVGSSTASSLLSKVPNARLVLGSRTRESYKDAIDKKPELTVADHVVVDIEDPPSVLRAIQGADLVVHTAGPFQRRQSCHVLEAAIESKIPYLDVCDDTRYSQMAKGLHQNAVSAGTPCITTGGIYPGLSNVMAAYMIAAAKDISEDSNDSSEPLRVLYSYYTAGSGGAGPTILDTTFLLAGEPVVAYKDDKPVILPAVSNRRVVDFGKGVGRRSVYLYSLPEVESGHQVFRVPNISARFGTSPEFWNWGMVALARLVPRDVLQNPKAVNRLASLADPLVRIVDKAVGEQVAMLIEVQFPDNKIAAGLFVHDELSASAGVCTSAFAYCMLANQCSPGVWFPEEDSALRNREVLLQLSQEGTNRFLVNKSTWELETDPVQLGLGFYL